MATYTNVSGVLECVGTDITAAGIAGFLDANPAFGSCVRVETTTKKSYFFTLLAHMRIGNTSSGPAASIWDCSLHSINFKCDAFEIQVYGRIQMGNISDGTSASGGSFFFHATTTYTRVLKLKTSGSTGGQLRFYGSAVYCFSAVEVTSYSEVTMLDCDIEAEDGFDANGVTSAAITLTRSRVHHTGGVGVKAYVGGSCSLSIVGVKIQKCTYAIQPWGGGTQTFTDLLIDSCTYHLVPNQDATNIVFINPDFTTLRSSAYDASDLTAIEFRYALKVADASGAALQNVSVRATDQQGSARFDTLTNASGNPTTFPSATLQNSTYAGVTKTDRKAHVLRVRHPNYVWSQVSRVADRDNLGDSVPIALDTLFTQSLATAQAHAGITITDHGGSPVSWQSKSWGISVTCDLVANPALTPAAVYHYLKYWQSYTATFNGKSGLDWHQLMPTLTTTARNDASFYAGVIKGVRIVDTAGNPLAGVSSMMADDGTTYSPPSSFVLQVTGLLAGSQVRVYTTGTQTLLASTASSGTSFSWSDTTTGPTVDVTVIKAGAVPIRLTGIVLTLGSTVSVSGAQALDREYIASAGLTFGTSFTVNTGTKRLTVATATTWRNLYGALIEAWRDQSALNNKDFPIATDGPTSYTLTQGWEFTSGISFLSRGGHRYTDTGGVEVAVWAAIQSLGSAAGQVVKYQQVDGSGTTTYGTGPIDGLIQTYGDASHGNFDRRAWLVIKINGDGYQDVEYDLVADGGVASIVDSLYVIPLTAESDGTTAGNPSVTGLAITDHGASPVSWDAGSGAKDYSITITDTNNNSADSILRWIVYNKSLGGTWQGKDAFNWAKLVIKNGSSFETVRGRTWGDVGAALKGVRVIRGTSTPHPGFSRFQADDGTFGAPPVTATAGVSGMTAGSRLQVYNVTTATEVVNAIQAGTAWSLTYTDGGTFTAGDVVRVRITHQSGATAKLAEQLTAIAGTTGWAVIADPVADDVYQGYGVDGSTCTEFSWDGVNLQIDVNDTDNTTEIQRIGAWYRYYITTSLGIGALFGGITWEKLNEIRINSTLVSLKLDNTKATPLLLTGGRIYRSDGATVIASTSGSIHVDYDPVYLIETGTSGLTGPESALLTLAAAGGADPGAQILEGSLTRDDAQRVILAVVAGQSVVVPDGAGGASVKFKSRNGSKDRVTATLVGTERTAVTVDGT